MPTCSRTPIPVNIAFAGGNTYDKARQMVDIKGVNAS
jgi:hypothetical protein